ncbi:SsgA family sporulation/cell division regulator [Kitasatospora kazusensis]|uniref:SsgA family sporulation/cell division regulator n=1 Tax=Kitasatospora kazusensis TaxID=407974 RepID=A0ABN2ZL42_9ACTN
MPAALVEQTVQADLILSTRRCALLRVSLRYRAADPFAVRMGFPAEYSLDAETAAGPGAEVEWVFARQLLATGLDLPSGLGDVHVRPAHGRHTMVELRAADGVALLRFDERELRRFLRHSYLAVPEGDELLHVDADRALAQLLG